MIPAMLTLVMIGITIAAVLAVIVPGSEAVVVGAVLLATAGLGLAVAGTRGGPA